MSSPKPIDRILAQAEHYLVRQIEADEIQYRDLVESPIEATLAMALCVIFDGSVWREHRWSLFDDNSPVRLLPQHQIGVYRVDFLLRLREDERQRGLVIECDGHDFHERTKDQAAADRARDRWLQAHDYTVFRFTGSEIWNTPLECAWQVHHWACDAAIWFARQAGEIA
jgi:very-short-patch-repair endonuclease